MAEPPISELENRVESRFGILPNFFRLAPETPEIVVKLLRRPFPRGQELQAYLSLCAAYPAPIVEIPMADTEMEDAIFVLAAHVFLKTSDYLPCLEELTRLLGPARLQYMLLFLAF